jgi:hypothetical protein
MRTNLTITLAVLVIVAIAALTDSAANRTSAQSAGPAQSIQDSKQIPSSQAQSKFASATCFCSVKANGTEVAKPTKGGYIQPIQAEACRNYCRGLWDSSSAQQVTWAKLLPGACGNVHLQMDAALGTMGYQTVRSGTLSGINGTQLVPSCPSGQVVSNVIQGGQYCIPPTGIPLALQPPNQLMGAYLLQNQVLYQILGPAGKKCV